MIIKNGSLLNLTTVFIETYYKDNYNNTSLGFASGFLYEHNNRNYIVTNWHVVSGRHFEKKDILDKKYGSLPNTIKTTMRAKVSNKAGKISSYLKIYDKNDKPIWYIHPKHGSGVDAVVIPLSKDIDNKIIFCTADKAQNNFPIEIAHDVFVLGFPKGISKNHLPIWKRASIATEPYLSYYDDKPSFLVDTMTREGMSGAPVFARLNSSAFVEDEEVKIFPKNQNIEIPSKFLGIYSGRLGKGEVEAQLGIVWKEELIKEIIEGKRLDDEEY